MSEFSCFLQLESLSECLSTRNIALSTAHLICALSVFHVYDGMLSLKPNRHWDVGTATEQMERTNMIVNHLMWASTKLET